MSTSDIEEFSEIKCLTCTWDDTSDCEKCEVQGKLDCKWNRSLLLRFYKGAMPAMLFGGIGFIIVGLFVSLIPLLIYIVFWIFFFGFFEIRVLCSHCPYYAEDGRILHCLANHGTIKLWKYHPEPLNMFEKGGFLAGALFFVLFPIITEVYGISALLNQSNLANLYVILLIGLSVLSLIGGIYFFIVLQKNVCPKCVNFSCPLNKVPKEIVDTYLLKNPVMKKAWEASGYKIN